MKKQLLLYVGLVACTAAFSQKYNFVNWTVEDGLIQSQASYICQDHYRQLWIGTQGGISKFDGKKFTGYTVQDGLTANAVNVISCDVRGNLWIGTNYGISVFNGKNFTSIKLSNNPVNNITAIIPLHESAVAVLNNLKLYTINGLTAVKNVVSEDSAEKVTALYRSKTSVLMAWVMGKGLYAAAGNTWRLLVKDDISRRKFVQEIFITSGNDTLLATNHGLYKIKHNKEVAYGGPLLSDLTILCMAEDQKKNIWLGSDNGVYRLNAGEVVHFDGKSGFTDNSVNHIYKDIENNLWFATDADGIYKFRENTFTYYDKSSGLSNTIIMGVAQTADGSIYAAGYGGLYKIASKNDLEPAKNEDAFLANTKINSLYADGNDLWIGTLGKGAWQYNEKKGLTKIEAKNNPDLIIRGATSFLRDAQNNLLIGGNQGLFVKNNNGDITRIKLPNVVITALKRFGRDSILAGTSKGVYVLDKDYHVSMLNNPELDNASVLCLAGTSDNILAGTTDMGVLNWNRKTGKIITYNTTNGLPSNFIYNLSITGRQKVWVGTGFGISNLQLDSNNSVLAIKNYGRSDGLLGMECSHNCVLKAADSSLWFGTTKGLFHFDPSTDITEKNQPLVLLRSVKLFSSPISDSGLYKNVDTWLKVPNELKLRANQNHLTFELGAIYFTNPDDVLYCYKLEGIDKDFTTSGNPYIIYPALPPGKYTLKVHGITKNGVVSVNRIDYTFEIEKAFYQTKFFQLIIILLIVGSSVLITYFFTRGRQKRKQRAKEMLEKIREEEFVKLRQRTAEDFHDEMGNSLTRISVLTDVLKSKLESKESEVTRLVQQIKENTNVLYNGSRDIIWSLNSQNDGMFEIAEHIKDIGIELFEETAVEFNYSHNIHREDNLKLKLDYSRNLTMIFKEVYNNALKHAKAGSISVNMELKNKSTLAIRIKDNGSGFQPDTVKQGNGIKNMGNRVKRLGGEMMIDSAPGKGTEINILLKNIFV